MLNSPVTQFFLNYFQSISQKPRPKKTAHSIVTDTQVNKYIAFMIEWLKYLLADRNKVRSCALSLVQQQAVICAFGHPNCCTFNTQRTMSLLSTDPCKSTAHTKGMRCMRTLRQSTITAGKTYHQCNASVDLACGFWMRSHPPLGHTIKPWHTMNISRDTLAPNVWAIRY